MSKRQEKKEVNLLPNTQPLQSAQSSNQNLPYHQGQQPVTMDPTILPSTSRKRNRVSGGNTGASSSGSGGGGGGGGGASTSSISHPNVSGGGGQRIGLAGSSNQGSFGNEAAESAMPSAQQPPVKKSRTNTPWTPAEEQRLKSMRDAQNSWAEIAKVRSQDKPKSSAWRLQS